MMFLEVNRKTNIKENHDLRLKLSQVTKFYLAQVQTIQKILLNRLKFKSLALMDDYK